jgi:hypothetical protein
LVPSLWTSQAEKPQSCRHHQQLMLDHLLHILQEWKYYDSWQCCKKMIYKGH